MKIYTSYFANLKNIKNPISICAKAPEWYKGPQYKVLAPKYGFFMDYKRGVIGEEGYTDKFYELVLNPLDATTVYNKLISFYPEADEITLLCFETPDKFCHRHLVANWLNDKLGLDIKEKINDI